MCNPLLIYANIKIFGNNTPNTPIKNIAKNFISFSTDGISLADFDLDSHISQKIIPEIVKKEFNILFIKDSLSDNYLELYGITLAYHIRLSAELGDKRFVPIVIISDVDGYILNKLTPMANILFTRNTFVARNEISSYDYFKKVFEQIQPFSDFKKEFLDLIRIDPPQDYLSHHSIANEWAMHRWAEYLDVTTDDIKMINEKISSMLYFKYLKAKFTIKKSDFGKHQQKIKEPGKILYIDDEWAKGWGNILKSLHSDLYVVEEPYKDRTKEEIIEFVLKKISKVDPDLVILDMRLHEDDFQENIHLDELTGIEIFKKIKELNEGIQFIIFTASSNTLLLEEIQSYDTNILSYIKKEHPDDINITIQGNINKLVNKINEGLKKKYLKEIWKIKNDISKLLGVEKTWEENPFSQYIDGLEEYKTHLGKLHKENFYIFDILSGSNENKLNYALVSLATSIDALQSIFIKDKWDKEKQSKTYYYLGEHISKPISNLPDQIAFIIEKSGYEPKEILKELIKLNKKRNQYIHSNPDYILPTEGEILKWHQLFCEIINKIKNRKTVSQKS